MEAVLVKPPIPLVHSILPTRWQLTNRVPEKYIGIRLSPRQVNKKMGYSRIIPWSKRSAFQDFQGFAKPSRLLPATETNIYTDYISEEILSSVALDKSTSFYMVELQTSKDFGSGLGDPNAAILLCLIDANGDSILQRIYAVSESIHFRRGSVDIATFKGPKLGKIEALWLGLESGSWRLVGVGLKVIDRLLSLSSSTEGVEEPKFDGLQYKFGSDSILLGEGGISVAELRPVLVAELSTENFSLNSPPAAASSDHEEPSNEEGMREYADLKLSLLLYDLIIVFTGSTILLTLPSREKDAFSFFIGGLSGFLYLLLLQRSVDGLSLEGEINNFGQGFGRVKGLLLSLALILAAGVVAVKYEMGASSMTLTPSDLFVGVAGFLSYKVAVLLAAIKPIQRSSKDNN